MEEPSRPRGAAFATILFSLVVPGFASLAVTGCSSGLVLRGSEDEAREDAIQHLRDVHLDFMDAEGLVDYEGLRRRPRLLREFLGAVSDGPEGDSPEAAKAFWINVHNGLVLRATSLYAPLQSLEELPAVFRRIRVQVGEETLSADEILDRKLRPFGDPRVLFALRMGSISGPTPTRVFEAASVERELQRAMLEELARSRTARLSPAGTEVLLARWMERYADWFGPGGARAYLARELERARPSLARALAAPSTEVRFLPWNDALDGRS